MSELMDAIREALDLRKSDAPRDTFDASDLIACFPLLKSFKAEEISKTLRAYWKFLGLAPNDW